MTVFASSRLYSSSYLYVPFGLLPSQDPCQESLHLPLVGHQGSEIWSGSNWDYRKNWSTPHVCQVFVQGTLSMSLGALVYDILAACSFWCQDKARGGQLEGILNLLCNRAHWLKMIDRAEVIESPLEALRRWKVIAHWRNTASITTQEKPLLGPNWKPLPYMLQLFMSDKAGCLSSGWQAQGQECQRFSSS
ncbi:hypothetical protein WJX82_009329 [Trebouxia sp. C0006]